MKKFFIYFAILITFNNNLYANLIFQAHRAGTWYPNNKNKLNKLLKKLTTDANTEFNAKVDGPKIRALICPHAGYKYSGKIAAATYNLLDKKTFNRVIILAPSHFVSFQGIALPTFEKYRTPLGTIDLDLQAIKKLKKIALNSNKPFKPEHSIEMQLPFIQFELPNIKIVPIVIGNLTNQDIKKIILNLKKIINKKTLVIVSTDFTHYGSNFNYIPFKDNILLNIKQLDSLVLNSIQHQSKNEFETVIAQTKDTVCGYNPLQILLELIKENVFGKVTTKLIAYGTSFEISKDENNIVSYASLITTNETDNITLNKLEQNELLIYARQTLEQAFNKTFNKDLLKPIMTNLLEKPQGVFPTLWKINKDGKKELRGCIGQVEPINPLYEEIANKTLASAFNDPRFEPLKEEELKNILIELSVLRAPKPVKSYKNIILHKHGIILENGNNLALFLPNVPKEFGFNLIQTLEQLSLKAGLDKNAWKSPTTKFQVFEAQDFEEKIK